MREVHQDTPKPTLRKGGGTPRTDNWLTTESIKARENEGGSCPCTWKKPITPDHKIWIWKALYPQPMHVEKTPKLVSRYNYLLSGNVVERFPHSPCTWEKHRNPMIIKCLLGYYVIQRVSHSKRPTTTRFSNFANE